VNIRAHNVVDLLQQECPEPVGALDNEAALLQFLGEPPLARDSRIGH
jgi:hypothetical protein